MTLYTNLNKDNKRNDNLSLLHQLSIKKKKISASLLISFFFFEKPVHLTWSYCLICEVTEIN